MNPIQWLMERSGNLLFPAWLVTGLYAFFALAIFLAFIVMVPVQPINFATPRPPGVPFLARMGMIGAFGWGTGILSLLLKIFFAVQACKFFTEARRSGALEIIMSTPLTVHEFIDGQWSGLKRSFFWPMILFLAIGFAYALSAIHFVTNSMFRPGLGTAGLPIFMRFFFNGGWFMTGGQVLLQVYKAVEWGTNVLAVGWVGMWLGLSSRNPNLAPALTILFVVVLPNIVSCVPGVIPDLIFVFWARRQLEENFRRYGFPQQWSYAGVPGLAPAPVRQPVARTF